MYVEVTGFKWRFIEDLLRLFDASTGTTAYCSAVRQPRIKSKTISVAMISRRIGCSSKYTLRVSGLLGLSQALGCLHRYHGLLFSSPSATDKAENYFGCVDVA